MKFGSCITALLAGRESSAQEVFMAMPASAAKERTGSARVGMMYEAWHAPAYWGRGPDGITLETVIRSNGSTSIADMRKGWSPGTAQNFHWHKEPLDGFYCIYRKRSNESEGALGLGDCPGITATLTRHAKMLVDAGMDFIVADSTNIQSVSPLGDAIQLRPWEVLAEEWLALRKQGIRTPKIAIWQNLQDPSQELWRKFADGAYADPAYDDLLFKDEHTGKKVFFTTANPAPALVETLRARGLAVVTMWAERDNFAQGEWAFFSPCTTNGKFTDTVVGIGDQPCDQKSTTGSSIGLHGTSLTVGPSYQLSYASLPFRASHKLGGLTLRKQFEKAFSMNAAGSLDYLMVGTFNEHVAQPQPNPYAANAAAISMGLEQDADGGSLWVDMYGDAVSRDLEPTKEDGGRMWDLFTSCMRVFQSGAAACGDATERCCDASDPLQQWVNIFSLKIAGDSLLTTSATERDHLAGAGWQELCAPFGGSSVFCAASNPPAGDYRRGPFLLYAAPLAATASAPVHRCLTALDRHLYTTDPDCRGLGKVEQVLGHVSLTRSSETPRSLRLCQHAAQESFYHSLDGGCGDGGVLSEHLGFVF